MTPIVSQRAGTTKTVTLVNGFQANSVENCICCVIMTESKPL